jgi:hypothetical protein
MVSVVSEMAGRYPDLWARAHREGDSQSHEYIRALAWELHSKHDARWGMNFKRDGSEISMDVVAFRIGPTDRHVECYDVIGGAGGDNPQAVWQDITNYSTMGQPGTARWAKPERFPEESGGGHADRPPQLAAPCKWQPAPAVDLQPVIDTVRQLSDVQAQLIESQQKLAEAVEVVRQNLDHLNQRLVQLGLQIEGSSSIGRISGTAKLPE